MGLSIGGGIEDFILEGARNSFKGKKILMLGKLDINLTVDELYSLARRMDYTLTAITQIKTTEKLKLIDSYSFFSLLGFDEVRAMDISDYEGADIIFDLNSEKCLPELKNRFDYIVDGGTLEHVFHVPNALNSIVEMLSLNGKVYHYVPAANYINHGFYSFSPSLFIDFYKSKKFFIENVSLLLSSKNMGKNTNGGVEDCLATIDYRTHNLMNAGFSILKDHYAMLRCIAQKKNVLEKGHEESLIQTFWYQSEELENALFNAGLDQYPPESVAIWGTGKAAEQLITFLKRNHENGLKSLMGLFDGADIGLIGKRMYGYEVLDYRRLDEYGLAAIIIGSADYEEVIYQQIKEIEQLKNIAQDSIKIIRIPRWY